MPISAKSKALVQRKVEDFIFHPLVPVRIKGNKLIIPYFNTDIFDFHAHEERIQRICFLNEEFFLAFYCAPSPCRFINRV